MMVNFVRKGMAFLPADFRIALDERLPEKEWDSSVGLPKNSRKG